MKSKNSIEKGKKSKISNERKINVTKLIIFSFDK